MKQIRAIVYGVGKVNQIATRLMLEKGIDIVGAVNRPGPKVGKDLGTLANLSPLGVPVLDNPEKVLSVPADLALVAVCDDMDRGYPIYRNCLRHRLNVVTVGSFMSYPWRSTPKRSHELDTLAKDNGVSLIATGNQDFFMVNLGLLMSGVCHNIRKIVHKSLGNINKYGPEVARLMGVGTHPDIIDDSKARQHPNPYLPFWENVIDELDLEIKRIEQRSEPVVAGKKIYAKVLGHPIEKGEVIGRRQHLEIRTVQGLRLVGKNTLRICEKGEEEYKTWQVDGEPGMDIRATKLDTVFTTASQAVNRIPDAINAKPGYITLKKLPKLMYKSKPFSTYIQKA